jgi:LysR family transcriptional regulator, regulator for bpeEF and oprC
MVGYFSSLTGRAVSMLFEKAEEKFSLDPRIAKGVCVNDSTAHLTALVSGLGVGQTFSFMARPWVESGDLVPILLQWRRSTHDLHIVFAQSKYNSARLKVFIHWIHEIFKPYDVAPATLPRPHDARSTHKT